MSPQLIVALIIAASSSIGGFYAAWQIQAGRFADERLAQQRQEAEDAQEAQRHIIRQTNAVVGAQSRAVVRERSLRTDAAGSRDALVGLSDAVDQILRAAAASTEACTVRAATIGQLLKDSERDYQSTAEKADRHANDLQTLMDAWSN